MDSPVWPAVECVLREAVGRTDNDKENQVQESSFCARASVELTPVPWGEGAEGVAVEVRRPQGSGLRMRWLWAQQPGGESSDHPPWTGN